MFEGILTGAMARIIGSIIIGAGGNYINKKKIERLVKKLPDIAQDEFFKKYQNEIFYNPLQAVIEETSLWMRFIKNIYNFDSKYSKPTSEWADDICNEFFKKHTSPEYKRKENEINECINYLT